jgi:hypothetical protein
VPRFSPTNDELDLAIIGRRRRLVSTADPFIGATLLVIASSVELDLRAATPAPTGIEIHTVVVAGRLSIRAQPDWRLDGETDSDAPLLRVIAVSKLGKVSIDRA